jgi:hypothetical protein
MITLIGGVIADIAIAYLLVREYEKLES